MNTGTLRGIGMGFTRDKQVTVTVAAVNASPFARANADYVCDGRSDEIEINAALAALPVGGGLVQLSEGRFTINGYLRFGTIGTVIQGMGMESTTIFVVNGTTHNDYIFHWLNNDTITLRDFKIDGNKANNASRTNLAGVYVGAYSRIERVAVWNMPFQGFSIIGGGYCVLLGCYARANDDAGYFISSDNNVIVGCIANANVGLGFDMTAHLNSFIGCRAANGVAGGFNVQALYQRNTFVNCVAHGNGAYGFRIDGLMGTAFGCVSSVNATAGFLVSAGTNQIKGCVATLNTQIGIDVSGGLGHTVIDNAVYKNNQHGIRVAAVDSHIANNNVQENGLTTHITYDGIQLTAAAQRHNVQGNLVRAGAAGNRQRYGINVIAGATNNLVTNNDLLTGGITGALNDAGTGTILILAAGNRV